MTSLALGQQSSKTNPKLALFTPTGGILTDVFEAEWRILEYVTDAAVATQVFPVLAGTYQAVDLVDDKVATGYYAAAWTVDSGAELGRYVIEWRYRFTDGGTQYTVRDEFEVLEALRYNGTTYATVTSFRDEGITSAMLSDTLLEAALVRASRFVEKVCGRVFRPVYKTMHVNGRSSRVLVLEEPICAVGGIAIEDYPFVGLADDLDTASYAVYNRHLTMNLFQPDDREDPKIAFLVAYEDAHPHQLMAFGQVKWPLGSQNIRVTGVFGYTEPDPEGPAVGVTPFLIQRVTQLLAMRDALPLVEEDRRAEAIQRYRIVQMRTRDQSITYSGGASGSTRGSVLGSITGDAVIDNLLIQYKRPLRLGAA